MPAEDFDALQLLQDEDYDIRDEHSSIMDGVLGIRRKFSSVVREGRQLQSELRAKQTEIDDLKTRLSAHKHSAEVARNQLLARSRRLQQYKSSEKKLRNRNRELIEELGAAHTQLEKASYLECRICTADTINTFTPCGHSYCHNCITLWLRQTKTGDEPPKTVARNAGSSSKRAS